MISENPTNLPDSPGNISQILLDNHLGTWTWNADTNTFLLDSYWSKLLGIPFATQGITGEDIFALVHPEDAPQVEQQWIQALQTQVPSEKYVFRIRTFDGKYGWVFFAASYTCSFQETRPCPQATGIILNLSDTKNTVSRLFSTNTKEKDHFLSSVSHELRTPINAIIGLSQFAQNHAPSALYKEYSQRVLQSAHDLLNLVNDLLDFSTLQAQEQTITLTPLEPRKLLELFPTKYQDLLTGKQLSLGIKIEPWVPKIILGDWERIYGLIDNLVSNSVKFTAKGRIQIYLGYEKGSHNKAYKLILRVRDTGIGMDPLTLTRLFTPFTQGDSSDTRRYGGTGIGLALVKKTAQALNARLTVATEPGKGTTVSAYIPYSPPSLPSIPYICTNKPSLTLGIVSSNPLGKELGQLAQKMQVSLQEFDDYSPVHRPDGWFVFDDKGLQTLEREKESPYPEPIIFVTRDPSNTRALVVPAEPQEVFEHFARAFFPTDSSSLELMELGGIPLLLFCSEDSKIAGYQQLFERYGIWVTLGNPQNPLSLPNLGIEYAITLVDLQDPSSFGDLRTKLQSFGPTQHTFLVMVSTPTEQNNLSDLKDSSGFGQSKVDLMIDPSVPGKRLLELVCSSYTRKVESVRSSLPANQASEPVKQTIPIDINIGLEQLDNDQELYQSMLSSFVDQAPEYLSHLKNLSELLSSKQTLTTAQQKQADFIIHQIKGGAARIQALDLLQCCQDWETLAPGEKFTESVFDRVITKVGELVFTLNQLLEDPESWQDLVTIKSKGVNQSQLAPEPFLDNSPEDSIQLDKLLKNIHSYLSQFQIMDSDLIHGLQHRVPSTPEAQETFHLFRKKVWSLQYEDATVLLTELSNLIRDGEA